MLARENAQLLVKILDLLLRRGRVGLPAQLALAFEPLDFLAKFPDLLLQNFELRRFRGSGGGASRSGGGNFIRLSSGRVGGRIIRRRGAEGK
jgi:hypothetical protein